MKRSKYLLFILVLLSSCSLSEKNIFDEPASIRVAKNLEAYQKTLVDSEHGWLMEYYPSSEQLYGGYSFVMQFNEREEVKVFSEEASDISESVNSLYTLKSDMGPVLSFNTYNKLFHYFSSPDVAEGEGFGKGYEGDAEFNFKSINEEKNEIILIGKKTRNVIRMFRMNETPVSYLQKIKNTTAKFKAFPGLLGFEVNLDGETHFIDYIDRSNFSIKTEEIKESGEKVTNFQRFSFIFTPEGIKLYEPTDIFGRTAQYFDIETKADDSFVLKCKDAKATELELVAKRDADFQLEYEAYLGAYTMTYKPNREGGFINKSVTITERVKEKTYNLEGLPGVAGEKELPLYLVYDRVKGTFMLPSQRISANGYFIAINLPTYAITDSRDVGVVSSETSPGTFEMIDNKKWINKEGEKVPLTGFLLFNGETGSFLEGYSQPWFLDISFTKNP